MKVFVSSTYVDLVEDRKKAIDILNHYHCIPLVMEFFDSLTEDPTTVCEKEIRECDLFIGIYAHRYGFVPDGQIKSITQMEYERAKELGKDRLCFIVHEDADWKPRFIEFEKKKELETFLNVVKKEHVLSFFTTPQDFGEKLAMSLGKWMGTKRGKDAGDSCIPRAPLPYIAHPYSLPLHFTGREAEIAVLSNWFYNEPEPVLVLEAIGGMGKSAMSWAWMQKEIMGKPVETEGVFWWSFYEEPFESFIAHLYCYVTGKDSKEGIDLASLMAALNHRRFLLVLDGLERALRGYAGMEAMFIQEKRFEGDPEAEARWEKTMREPVHPQAGRFFQALTTGNTRTLITTRLMSVPLEGVRGVKRVNLTGLSPTDTVRFLKREGVKGTRAELEDAGRVYESHPLMLTLLVASISRSRTKDIRSAFSENLIDRKEPHKILSRSFGLLSEEERRAAVRVSVFRGVFTFEAVKALIPEIEEDRLWVVLQGLRRLGFLFYDDTAERFDLHPILRSFLYRQLTAEKEKGEEVHTRAVEYFKALPKPEKVVNMEDLGPVIELYHHLIKAGKCDEAFILFRDRMGDPIYYQLSVYHLIIEMLKSLFPGDNSDYRLPRLESESAQGWTLNALANTYAISGFPAKAVPLYLQYIKLSEKNFDKKNLSVGLINAAQMAQIHIGQLSASCTHVRKRIALCRKIKDEFQEAVGHLQLGRVLLFRGQRCDAEEEFKKGIELAKKINNIQVQGVISTYRSFSALLQMRLTIRELTISGTKNWENNCRQEALEQAHRALFFAEKYTKTDYPRPRDFIRVYWMLGEALVLYGEVTGIVTNNSFEIPFYDEYFQQQKETVMVKNGNEIAAAERCILEALNRCQKTNMVFHEPDILLALSRLARAKGRPPDETRLEEIREIALRSGYRIVLADLHLFCAQVLLETNDHLSLLGFTAIDHLTKTKDYARDISEFSDIYQSPNPDFYKGIPEYEMLKRGMTDEERVENGYLLAYRMAEELLNKK